MKDSIINAAGKILQGVGQKVEKRDDWFDSECVSIEEEEEDINETEMGKHRFRRGLLEIWKK